MSMPGAIACIGGGGFLVDDLPGVQERPLLPLVREQRGQRPRILAANVRLPGEEAREVLAVDLSSR